MSSNNSLSDFENAIIQGSSKKARCSFAMTLSIFMVCGVVTNFVFPYTFNAKNNCFASSRRNLRAYNYVHLDTCKAIVTV